MVVGYSRTTMNHMWFQWETWGVQTPWSFAFRASVRWEDPEESSILNARCWHRHEWCACSVMSGLPVWQSWMLDHADLAGLAQRCWRVGWAQFVGCRIGCWTWRYWYLCAVLELSENRIYMKESQLGLWWERIFVLMAAIPSSVLTIWLLTVSVLTIWLLTVLRQEPPLKDLETETTASSGNGPRGLATA